MNLKKYTYSILYVTLAGVVTTYLLYYMFFKLLGFFESTQLVQPLWLLLILSPLIGPALGAYLFLKIGRDHFSELEPVNLWKHSILFSFIIGCVIEWFTWNDEPSLQGFYLLISLVIGAVLAVIAYRKTKFTNQSVGNSA